MTLKSHRAPQIHVGIAVTVTPPFRSVSWVHPKEVVRLDYQGGSGARRGRWIVPRRLEIRAVGGAVKLDFSDAMMTGPILDIQAEVRGGRLCSSNSVGHRGGRRWRGGAWRTGQDAPRTRAQQNPAPLRVNVSAEADGGIVIVRPHRKLWPWVQRRPRRSRCGLGCPDRRRRDEAARGRPRFTHPRSFG